jgi:cation transport ATPase
VSELARVNRRNLAAALGYNAVAVGLACAGVMSPLLCAVFMPASSLTVLLATVAALNPRSPLWRS